MEECMSMDELRRTLRARSVILRHARPPLHIAIWTTHGLERKVTQALRQHRVRLAALLAVSDVRTCPAPGLHRASFYYKGQGLYICGDCERLARWVEKRVC